MIKVKRILVAVDFSAVSANALRHAAAVAQQFSAALDVVNALPLTDIDLPANASAKYVEEMRQSALQQRRKELKQFVKQNAAKLTDALEHVCLGSPTEEVIEAAKQLHADLIVIGTHGRTGLKHLLVGSVAESVLRHADVPVLCIRSPA
jgi:nucleotide-binding universal stress UspA family protein